MIEGNSSQKKDASGKVGAVAIGAAMGVASAAGVAMAMQHPKVRKIIIALKDKAIEKAKPLQENVRKIGLPKEGGKSTKVKSIR